MNKFTMRDLSYGWVEGEYEGRRYQAKVYDEPSDYGINGGRVSKLWVRGTTYNTFINYDRGWDAGEDVVEVWKPLVALIEKNLKPKAVKS